MEQQILNIFKDCYVEGNVIVTPTYQIDRTLYMKFAKVLEGIGGKWDQKSKGFLFKSDPTELFEQIKSGNKINLKKQYQFFQTPDFLADTLVKLAGEIKEDVLWLEPSAGMGAIVDAIYRKYPQAEVDCVELLESNCAILQEKGYMCQNADFLTYESKFKYDVIVANPPFAKNQDIAHVKKMYSLLKRGGVLVSVMSKHWTFAKEEICVEFRNWIKTVGGTYVNVESGVFKESGTNVETVIVTINKRGR